MRRLAVTLGICASVVAPLQAQDTPAADSARAREPRRVAVLDIMIDPNVNEPHRVLLLRGVVYRAVFSQGGAVLYLRMGGNSPAPFFVNVSTGGDASGLTEYEIYPAADAMVEISASFTVIGEPIHFVLYRDNRATARRRGRDFDQPIKVWEYAAEFQLGRHGELPDGSTGRATEGCFEVRRADIRRQPFFGCVLGVASLDAAGPATLVLVFFEPRLMLWGAGDEETPPFEVGLAYRFGIGSLNGAPPGSGEGTVAGPSAYAAWNLGRGEKTRGWRLRGSLARERIGMQGGEPRVTWIPRLGVAKVF